MPQRRGLAGAAVPGLVCGRLFGLVCLLAVKGLCEGPGKRRAACLRRELAVWLFLQEARS